MNTHNVLFLFSLFSLDNSVISLFLPILSLFRFSGVAFSYIRPCLLFQQLRVFTHFSYPSYAFLPFARARFEKKERVQKMVAVDRV